MAKYKVIKCELLKDRNEFDYLKLELLNTHLMWEPTIALLIHDPNVISRIIDATWNLQKELPENMSYIYGKWIDYSFGFPFYKKHTTAHPAWRGRPAIKVGDLVCDALGNPVEYKTIMIFCMYTDESCTSYVRGYSPEEVARKLLNRYCVPANKKEDYIVSVNGKQHTLTKVTQDTAMECANAISNLTDNNVVLSKVIYKLTSNSHTADNTGCTIVPQYVLFSTQYRIFSIWY